MPYKKAGDDPKLPAVLQSINASDIAFSIYDGDIKDGSSKCTDDVYIDALKMFNSMVKPVVYVPGDNEWTDCHRTGFDPLERLAKVRRLFHTGTVDLPGFARQSPARSEHVRWTWEGAVFVGLNVPGSNNNLGRTPEMDDEFASRMFAVSAWLREAEQLASAPHIRVLVVMMQANPDFEGRPRNANLPDGYAGLRAALAETARRLGKPLVVAHGDTHRFKHDRPVAGAPNLVRLEVDGWPWLGWLHVGLPPGGTGSPEVIRTLHP
jgi:hypothetical protein